MGNIVYVNSQDQVIGVAQREEVTQQNLIRRIVRILVINPENKVLLQYRSKQKSIFPLTWDQSVGGHVDETDEGYLDAAVREVSEELSLIIEPIDLNEVAHFYCEESWNGNTYREYNKLYVLKSSEDKFTIQESEVESVRWFTIEEVDIMFNEHVDLLSGGFRVAWAEFRKQF